MPRGSRGDFLALSFQPAQIRRGRTPSLDRSGGFGSLLIEQFALQLGIASNAGKHTDRQFDFLLSFAPLCIRGFVVAESFRAVVFRLAPFLWQSFTLIANPGHVA